MSERAAVENITSIRGIMLRVVGAVVGVVLLYLLGFGPLAYLVARYNRGYLLYEAIYDPLFRTASNANDRNGYFRHYQWWWVALGESHRKSR